MPGTMEMTVNEAGQFLTFHGLYDLMGESQ